MLWRTQCYEGACLPATISPVFPSLRLYITPLLCEISQGVIHCWGGVWKHALVAELWNYGTKPVLTYPGCVEVI